MECSKAIAFKRSKIAFAESARAGRPASEFHWLQESSCRAALCAMMLCQKGTAVHMHSSILNFEGTPEENGFYNRTDG